MAVSRPLLTLHSGAGGTEPNSREYLNYAAKVHPDYVEVDVRITSDNVAVLHHDPFVQMSDKTYLINEKSLKELLVIKPGLLLLGEAMDFCRKKGLKMNFDLKTPDALKAIFHETEIRGFHKEFVFSGCNPPHARIIKMRNAAYNILLSIQDDELQNPAQSAMNYYKRMLKHCQMLGCAGVNINYKLCSIEMIELAHEKNIPVALWTVDSADALGRCRERGIGSITTNRADLFRKIY